jgi:hypothetical protein
MKEEEAASKKGEEVASTKGGGEARRKGEGRTKPLLAITIHLTSFLLI